MLDTSVWYIFFFAITIANEVDNDYCDPKWCPDQGKHIACNNDGSFGEKCKGKFWVEDMEPYKDLILNLHNNYRNEIALGNVPNFKTAARMPTLKWDKSLKKLAELNVKTCYFEHDGCRSTSEFPYCGQNIYFAQTTFTNETTVDYIKEALEMWFLEHKDCNMDVVGSFQVTTPQTGHFTALTLDRNDRVGCGFLQSIHFRKNKKPLKKIHFTCNYPSTNILGIPTYEAGPPACLCNKSSDVYKGLCSEEEVIDPNDFMWYFYL